MKPISTTQHEKIFNFQLNEALECTKNIRLEHVEVKKIQRKLLSIKFKKTICIDGSIVNVTGESNLLSFSPSATPGFEMFTEPTTSLFPKLNKQKIGDITNHLEILTVR